MKLSISDNNIKVITGMNDTIPFANVPELTIWLKDFGLDSSLAEVLPDGPSNFKGVCEF